MKTQLLALPRWQALLLALLSGSLITLGFAPFGLWPIAVIALTLFALLLKDQPLNQVIWRSFVFGIGLYAAGIHWIYVSIHYFGGASPLLSALLVLLFAAFMAAIFTLPFYLFGRWFNHHSLALIIALPACWLLGEWMRTWLLTGFPWLFIGYAHLDTWLSGWAPVAGVMGLSVISVFTSGLIAQWLWQYQKSRALIIASGACIAFWIAGAALKTITWAEPDEQFISVGMVQPNVDQSTKLNWDYAAVNASLNQLRDMSENLWTNNWVIWPEAAIPTALTYQTALPFLEEMNTRAAQSNAALFTGVIFADRERNHYYNSIAGLGEGLGFYHKRRLVPFGEYVPLEDYVRGLIEFFDLPTSFINIGPREQHGLIAHGIRITPAICYEIVYPDLIAEGARETQVLLSVNNLGWFLDSIQSKQFMQMAQMRALETGRYLIYSTNNGPSAIIDNKGKILSHSDSFTEQTFTGQIHPVKDWTPFMAIGSGPLALLASIALLALAFPRLQELIPGAQAKRD
ncbi:apolipoprotein N-acyltransferase [Cellvibrio japonicus]|uniref:Apolipoprotein N-acyltransferase n=1 Tax=Cellvibrio japonicus (strain Ueda107) TaxID=498211 RepID=B3PER1_CELJU|nr:apolipoprotein N-acyltransferase [Cellvibrio japonicus]ACE83616.1 apolipoprotein N-acyltransferase [Cellvibrio japonicus Ueda107]QEI12165.1 apolipoprotein N-acyltransferase [Cellvibrio japonicus]QEI15739.1 apolipoprotein N-acyltransferase [Cellvibrio japonicus]QEI19317.1 apolipoprotein N-acyltransferase [Cellvibrio japonicus]